MINLPGETEWFAGEVLYIRRKVMKRKELEEFKKRWEENLGGLGEMLNSPWFAVSIKYDEAEKK